MSKMSKIIKYNYEILTYLFFGVLTTIVNYISYILSTRLLNMNVEIATIVAWIISILFAFLTNKIFVFKSKAKNKELIKELSSFVIARIFSLIIDIFIMFLFVTLLNFDDLIIKIISNVIVVLINYILSKLFIFKNIQND